MTDLLTQGLRQLDFLPDEILRIEPLMEKYINELVLFNSAYNLVNTDSHDELVVNHILDSLSAWSQIKKIASELQAEYGSQKKVIIGDIGSGGGLPGIPLAASLPELDFVLVERMSKRCAFLENVSAVLGLKNVTVKNIEAERVERESVDVAVFRAFRPLDKKMIKTLLNIISQNGVLAAYKAKLEKIKEEMSGINYTEEMYKIIPLEVPFLTDKDRTESRERNLVLIKK